MERFSFDAGVAFTPNLPLLEGVTVAPLTPPAAADGGFQAAIFRIEPGGRIARHPATHPQILAVLAGSGRVSGADGAAEAIGAGEFVFWHADEEHETTTTSGLTALVLEGDALEPFRPRSS